MKKINKLFQVSAFCLIATFFASCAEDATMDELVQDIEKYDASATDEKENDSTPPPIGN
jgi:outer membrane murein-binding lipoprotein Lpp